MKQTEVVRAILNALKKEITAVGYPTAKVAGDIFEAIRSGKVSKHAKRLDPSGGLAVGYIAMMISKARKEVASHPPKDEAELEKWLEQMQGIRYRLRPLVQNILETAHEISPHKKRGPRPRLSDEQKRAACSFIETMKRAGNTTEHSIRLAASNFRITERNMRHIWQTKGQ